MLTAADCAVACDSDQNGFRCRVLFCVQSRVLSKSCSGTFCENHAPAHSDFAHVCAPEMSLVESL